jgi:murein endopeptidase
VLIPVSSFEHQLELASEEASSAVRRSWVEAAGDEALWPLPEPMSWQLDDQGLPLVLTARRDEMWMVLSRKFGVRWIKKRFKVSLDRLRELNLGVEVEALGVGDMLVAWRREPEAIARSVGSPNRGLLLDGEPLPPGDKYVMLYEHRTFGTFYTISEIVRVMSAYALEFPEAKPIIIGDISFLGGRRIVPHLSHTSGRDVDMTYPRFDDPPDMRRFHPIPKSQLDVERSLWLLRAFLEGGQVERIFMDRWVQRLLREEAQRQGAPAQWLDAVFQYPGHSKHTIVIASPGHGDHLHIRFRCQPTDIRCE